ncbi:MAG: c-type cytochrome, partial [Verrucomicrobia bacterium]|nr:c-type cytochrome [Verrucomicrobiota bacterium]
DGRADIAVDYAVSKSGGMGLCFDGPNLYFVGDGGLWRFTDANGDGVADGPATKLLSLKTGEHGAHAIRQGPDGSWFLMAGNDAEVHAGLLTDPRSPIRSPEAGALIRFSPDFTALGVFAHGFRNPYDFDFNWAGDLLTYDSDVEREWRLPWYTPTRLYHIAYAGHHGWRLPGYLRSFHRPDVDPFTIPMLRDMGRGSPTGVVAYRHYQFPPAYQNGLFLLDWTFGRVWFAPTEPSGATYDMPAELFLEPMGTAGFAPTDAAVAPDGALLISIGGRKTRGAVYRIQYTADPARMSLATNWVSRAATDAELALIPPQPLDAWCRAFWRPMAMRMGAAPFDAAVLNAAWPDSLRIRAIEVLTEVHGGLMTGTARQAAKTGSPFVRARVAWSLGRSPCADFAPVLLDLALDASPLARRNALEAIAEQVEGVGAPLVAQAALANATSPEKRLRQLAAQLAAFLPLENWKAYYASLMRGGATSQLACSLAVSARFPTNGLNQSLLNHTLQSLKTAQTAEEKLIGVMLLQQGMGGWRIHDPSVEALTAYEAAFPPPDPSPIRGRMLETARPYLSTQHALLISETARLLAMLADPSPTTAALILDRIHARSDASSDFHYLAVLSRLKPTKDPRHTERVALAILGLGQKMGREDARPKQTWQERLQELHVALLRRDAELGEQILRSPGWTRPENLALLLSLEFPARQKAGRGLLGALRAEPAYPWNEDVVRLLGTLPATETRAAIRAQWRQTDLRDSLILALAKEPQPIDREKFVAGLASNRPEVARAALDAWLSLPRQAGAESEVGEALRLLGRLSQTPSKEISMAQTIRLINQLTGKAFAAPDPGADPATVSHICQAIVDACAAQYPLLGRTTLARRGSSVEWEAFLRKVEWEKGNPQAGQRLFDGRRCQACHGANSNIGPDLAGVTRRWSPRDLFNQIRYPSREIAEAYRATLIETRDGVQHLGLVAFFSADGVILRGADGRTERIAEQDIAYRRQADDSIMPEGLLDGLNSQDIADLYAHLRQLDLAK